MDKTLAKNILNNLNFNDLCAFSYKLLKNSYGKHIDLYDKINGNNSFLRRFNSGDYEDGFIGIYLIDQIPYDLFENKSDLIIDTPFLRKKLEIIKRDYQNQFFIPGVLPQLKNPLNRIFFLNNLQGFSREFYQNILIPKYEKVTKEIGVNWNKTFEVGIGSPDSFLNNNPQKAINVLTEILNTKTGISIDLTHDHRNILSFNSEKYLTNGVSLGSKTPFYPIYTQTNSNENSIISEFEHLIKSNPTESKIEKFLKEHYKDVFGFKYDKIETQIWLKFPNLDINKKNRRLDILLHNSISSDWELYELKKVLPLTSTYRDIPIISREISASIQQVLNYERILQKQEVKDYFKAQGIEYFEPSLNLVVGRTPTITTEQWRWLVTLNKNVKLLTYDDLLKEMSCRFEERLKF